jgi:hypothetical protein
MHNGIQNNQQRGKYEHQSQRERALTEKEKMEAHTESTARYQMQQ